MRMRECRPSCPSAGKDGFFLRANTLPLPLLLALIAACGDGGTPRDRAPADSGAVVVTDDAGVPVRLDAPARRVVSLVPSVTDVVLALGLGDRLIARTDYDADARLAGLPSVGPGLSPNLEWLAAQAPDLVIAWRDVEGRALVDRLVELGIPVYSSRLEDVETALSTITRVATLLGEGARGDSLRASMQARFDSVRLATRRTDPPTVLYLVGGEPPYAPGPGTFVDELIGIAGGRNLLADMPPGWHSISVEEVVRRDPDVIVIPVHGAESASASALLASPGWRDLRATRERRVFEVDGELFGRPGPRLDRAAAELGTLLGRAGTRAHARESGR